MVLTTLLGIEQFQTGQAFPIFTGDLGEVHITCQRGVELEEEEKCFFGKLTVFEF